MLNTTYFTYDGIKSEQYNLAMAEVDAAIIKNIVALSPNVHTTKPQVIDKFFYNGTTYDGVTQRTFSIYSTNGEISNDKRREILSWLFGSQEFKVILFRQKTTSYTGTQYQCVFTSIDNIFINNRLYGFKLTAIFDSPGSETYQLGPTMSGNKNLIYIAYGLTDGYIYPVVRFTGDEITIINKTDDPEGSRPFKLSGCSEYTGGIMVDNELKTIITNDTHQSVDLSLFKGRNWLRLRNGNNTLQVECNGTYSIDAPKYTPIGF